MQDRLDNWRSNVLNKASNLFKPENTVRRCSKGDCGDVLTIEEWEKESKLSQTFRR